MKIKHYTFFSDSHRICLKYFLNTFPFEDNVDLTIRHIPQECESAEYESDGFDKSMIRKVEFINQSFSELDDNDILIFTDADVVFLKPYKDLFLTELGNSDIIFQSDGGTVCMGVFCCRVSNKTRSFFKELLDILNVDASTLKRFKHDQQAANLMLANKNYGLNIKLFSHKVFNCGFLGKRYEGEDKVNFPNDMVVLHANFTIGLENKIKLIKLALNNKNNNNIKYGIENKKHLGGYIVGFKDHGDPNSYATEVWDWMFDNGIQSVIDVGCGEGHSTKYFLQKNIDCIGIEGGENAYNNSPVKQNLILHDYTEGPYKLEKEYDAVWCCEFVEHVEEKYLKNFLETFKCAKKIFMTHAVIGQDGYHHVNCQNSQYWIDKIQEIGFKYNNELSLYLRSLTNKMHVKNTLLVFEKL